MQTVPSIALFALLIAPLASLAAALPGWGIQGIGLLPAVIALTLYALLPIVHGTVSGLRQVPSAAVEAATGMGMTPRQVDELSPAEYQAMIEYAVRAQRDDERAARRAARKRG